MGAEIAQEQEWSESRSLDWHLLENPMHQGVQTLVKSLNAVEANEPSLWANDFGADGFRWIDANDTDQSVYSFLRYDTDGTGRTIACIANMTPVPRHGYRLGVPHAGQWTEVLDTDAHDFGGSGITNGTISTDGVAWHGFDQSLVLTLPPLAVLYLAPD